MIVIVIRAATRNVHSRRDTYRRTSGTTETNPLIFILEGKGLCAIVYGYATYGTWTDFVESYQDAGDGERIFSFHFLVFFSISWALIANV
jgi:hypothetical protein